MHLTKAATSSVPTGREASRIRRAALVEGKTALPPAQERTRGGEGVRPVALPSAPSLVAHVAPATPVERPVTAPASTAAAAAASGRALSRQRRQALIQGKAGLQHWQATAQTIANRPEGPSASESALPRESGARTAEPGSPSCAEPSCREIAQRLRAQRARYGRGEAAPARPSGRLRDARAVQYAPKVSQTNTYSGQRVSGIRIGRGTNVTGDEPGAALPVTGTQYIGTETGYSPRQGGVKVGAARTTRGLVVTGTQVRNQVKITGDESNAAIRITGEADQELVDDLVQGRDQGTYVTAQFQRQSNPHGQSVFGTNLGRSIRSIGSRERERARAIEQTESGLPISGTAVGRSGRVTGDEAGSCRAVTGDQYLMPASQQALCDSGEQRARARAGSAMARAGRIDPVTGEKVVASTTWTRQRITGADVEHNPNVTGDEPGSCAAVTGTPYVGPGQYENFCAGEDVENALASAMHKPASVPVTGDTPLNVAQVTGTQRGAEKAITGTAYYREEVQAGASEHPIESIDRRFSVRSPQRQAQLHAQERPVPASAQSRITGAFAVGEGKITGNKEFHFTSRGKADREMSHSRITGEGRVEGPAITGGAWAQHDKVTGTEGYIAAERNPSERAGKPHGFASSTHFKDKGKHEAPKQLVTGMVGWSAKSAAKVTLSGGAQG